MCPKKKMCLKTMYPKTDDRWGLKKIARIGLVAGILGTMPNAFAGDRTVDAAIGGGIGGALGGAVGSEVGGREGAIIGAAAGAAIGAAVATDDGDHHEHHAGHAGNDVVAVTGSGHPKGYFCPPGQAKKNRC